MISVEIIILGVLTLTLATLKQKFTLIKSMRQGRNSCWPTVWQSSGYGLLANSSGLQELDMAACTCNISYAYILKIDW